MKIGIVGPTKVEKFCEIVKIAPEKYLSRIVKIAQMIARKDYELVVVPHKKSISETIAIEYKNAGGKKVWGVVPMDDTEFGIDYLNQEIVDEIINCSTWRNQPEKLDEESDILICLGLGAGSMVEIFQTKWFKVDKIIIIEDFITQRLPIELKRDVNIEYVKFDDLEDKI